MKKQELIRDMKKECGSFPNTSQIAKYMRISRNRVNTEIVNGLDFVQSGRSKQYFVGDVAERIMQQRAM